jgi:hypothetical protein
MYSNIKIFTLRKIGHSTYAILNEQIHNKYIFSDVTR